VKAAFDGIVRIVRFDPRGYGYYVLLRHYNGLETLYGHLSKQLVEVGKLVKAGDLIGWGGNTGRSSGPHLHYEVRYQGNAFNASSVYDFPKGALVDRLFSLTPSHFSYFSHRKQAVVRRPVYHVVRRGDTLGAVARRYGTSVTSLCRLNRISSRSTLRTGQRLRVR
jgi:murein DD-endopeptidase MepM/ murein hydrolase activator NlpD